MEVPHRLDYFPDRELISRYRQVFSSNEGQEVLTHMLFDLGIFELISDGPEDVALKNHGIRLIKIISGGEPAAENIKDFMKRLMKQPLPKKREEDD